MHNFNYALKYLKHQTIGRNAKGYGIHSPSLFYLVTEIVNDFTPYYCFPKIEKRRSELLKNKSKIRVEDYGSGSRVFKSNNRKIGDIAKHASSTSKKAQLIFRVANYCEAKNILEIGSSFGLSTSYLASISKKNNVVSLEGCPETAKIAEETFNKLGIENIDLKVGEFDDTLPEALQQLGSLDLVYFDGNHSYKPTVSYFEACLQHIHNQSIFIFDDIHLNDEMEQAWEKIKQHPKVTCTLDLFHVGLVFFKQELTKEHHLIRFL